MNQFAENSIPFSAALAVIIPLLITLIFIGKLALHSRRLKMKVEAVSMIGLIGKAESEITDQGVVFVRGELWPAYAQVSIPNGAKVRVTGFKRLALEVEALQQPQN
jgi:membrane-bound ClpP family serine protease